jgi:FkbM family methyltransferase
MPHSVRTIRGLLRSLRIYYGDRPRHAAMRRLYASFLRPGDLAFDIGAHVGDRVAAFRALQARVIALEPQPACATLLRVMHALDRKVTVVAAAAGRQAGTMEMMVNIDNPTVSTVSPAFIRAARGAAGWERETWTHTIRVPVVTIDDLIARYGLPSFAKIDVEGHEAEALSGLSQPIPTLSFEFTTIQREVATTCLARCASLGYDRFNAVLGERPVFVHNAWQSAEGIGRWLAALPHEANSGDIYATRS